MLTVNAYAKVNLTLEVLGKREDGYHQVSSVMQTIDLCDQVHFSLSDRLSLTCNVAPLETQDNLVLRAAALLKEHTGCSQGAEIHLDKAIPLASGLGGGSSDAAATLKALDKFWGLGLGHEELLSLAASLGSDVPFFLQGGTALVEGRGEEVRSLPAISHTHFVLLVPTLEIPGKTATMYGRITDQHYTAGNATLRLRHAIGDGRRPTGKLFFNAFEDVAFGLFPVLEEHRRALMGAGAGWVRMTGTGPALYTAMASRKRALAMAELLRSGGYRTYVASTVGPSVSE